MLTTPPKAFNGTHVSSLKAFPLSFSEFLKPLIAFCYKLRLAAVLGSPKVLPAL